MPSRPARPGALALLAAASLAVASAAPTGLAAQDDVSPASWALTAAKGVIDLCRNDAPDANAVADHGAIWGWPTFVPYLEHPDGYKREAGGESRREYTVGDTTAEVEVTVQSGQVASAAPARIHYFRCDIASNQPILGDLEGYLTTLYGAPVQQADGVAIWLTGAAAGDSGPGDDAALTAVTAAGAGAEGVRVELTRDQGRDRAKITEFRNLPAD